MYNKIMYINKLETFERILKKYIQDLKHLEVCWRHHRYYAGNVSCFLSAYQCSIPFLLLKGPTLEYWAPLDFKGELVKGIQVLTHNAHISQNKKQH